MFTQVRSPQELFSQPQRLLVPLFQRRYVWSQEQQWEPLWGDIVRLVGALAAGEKNATHFLGAVVLQDQPTALGSLPIWTIIDGQQRLTTIQVLLAALHAQLRQHGWDQLAGQVIGLVENAAAFHAGIEDRYKVWPTNKDQVAFASVMSLKPPIDYTACGNTRLVKAHEYFFTAIGAWLKKCDGQAEVQARSYLVPAVTTRLQVVVIQLLESEDAQEIFETLNDRMTRLTAADLIKNLIFQRLKDITPAETEQAYSKYWADFETPFWEKDVSTGPFKGKRSVLFFTQWLTARTLKEIPAREVFGQFKRYVDETRVTVSDLLPTVKEAADRYKDFIERSQISSGVLDRLELFVYRTGTLDSEVAKPLLLWLEAPEQRHIPDPQRQYLIAVLESWFVRRALVRVPSQGTNRFLLELLNHLNEHAHDDVGRYAEQFLSREETHVSHWPGDEEVTRELAEFPAYTRLRKARLRMVLEAIEDHLRGYPDGKRYTEGPITRGVCQVEHIMPQEWRTNWKAELTPGEEDKRDRLVQTLGNLTLLTKPLNVKLSNAAWAGPNGKRAHLDSKSSLLLTRDVVRDHEDSWGERDIRSRTSQLVDIILAIWPVPAGHTTAPNTMRERTTYDVEVADLVRAELLCAGDTLYARPAASRGRIAELSEDGQIWVDGRAFDTPSGAAKAVSGNQQPGWNFWATEPKCEKTLADLRSEYLAGIDNNLDDELLDQF